MLLCEGREANGETSVIGVVFPSTSISASSVIKMRFNGNFLTFQLLEFKLYNMNLKTVLSKETINLHLKGVTKEAIINELLDILVTANKIQNREAALVAVMERERKMSTGMKHGIAIPHGKSDTIRDLVACIGIADSPVDFDSLDNQPCRLFIMTLSPIEKTGPHLQFLAEISLLFKSSEKRAEILAAQTPEEILHILAE